MPTMRFSTILLTSVLLSAFFAGCAGDKGPTTADFSATPLNGDKSSYKFDAGNSSGAGLVFTWDFGDQSPAGTGEVVEHTYQYLNGDYSVKLSVLGSDGVTSEKMQKVTVGSGANTAPLLYLTTDTRWVAPGGSVTFDATQSYDADGDPIEFVWDFNDPREQAGFNNMENLGGQQYGIYRNGPPPGAETGNGTDGSGDNGTGLMFTPSGYDWAVEYAKAKVRAAEAPKRLADLTGVQTFDGDHSTVPEPRAPGVDGTTSDTGPIQIYSFPEPATYFVYVKVVDIKGTYSDGFIRINVDPNVPETSYSNESSASLAPSAVADLLEEPQEGAPKGVHPAPFNSDYPAVFDITLTWTPAGSETSPVPTQLQGWVCGATQTTTSGCKGGATGMAPWESGATYTYMVEPKLLSSGPGALKAIFATMPDEAGAPSGGADITVTINGTIYPNKWFLEDAGLLQGH